jgi:hypothetical protein
MSSLVTILEFFGGVIFLFGLCFLFGKLLKLDSYIEKKSKSKKIENIENN